MTGADSETWYAAHTAGAPEALRLRAEEFFRQAGTDSGPGLTPRLAAAGRAALAAATRHAADRSAALDLLAADALITLALLAAAEQDPANLGRVAADLRVLASTRLHPASSASVRPSP